MRQVFPAAVILSAALCAGIDSGYCATDGPGTAADGPGSSSAAAGEGAAAGMVLAAPRAPQDPCFLADAASNPTRPNWDLSAQTTQCGVIEIDSGWLRQPMGAGVRQTVWLSSMRYGLTPRLDLRWGLIGHIAQNGGGASPLEGAGDQWLSARYRFLDQGKVLPALAFIYGAKIPTANPAKGFGSGYADNQFTLIASRDLGKNHFDFNVVGTAVGQAHGHDGAAQFGLAFTRPLSKKLSWILESYGGPQPGTSNRFGAAFTGVSYALRPALAVDAAYSRTYTAGSPREQFAFGFTYALRPGFAPLPKGMALSRLLGR
jgi:hypothetical protein